jgi:hypothetical protein
VPITGLIQASHTTGRYVVTLGTDEWRHTFWASREDLAACAKLFEAYLPSAVLVEEAALVGAEVAAET